MCPSMNASWWPVDEIIIISQARVTSSRLNKPLGEGHEYSGQEEITHFTTDPCKPSSQAWKQGGSTEVI